MPKVKMDYSKFSKDKVHVEKTQEGYFEGMSNKRVQINLTSGKSLEGTLRADLYNRYDVLLDTEEGRYLLRKDCIEYVRAISDTKEVK